MRLVFLLLLLVAATARAEGTLAAKTVVLYNSNDPESEQLAHYYAARRDIPDKQVLALRCPVTEEISREEYDTTIAEPLRRAFDAAGWWEVDTRKNGPSIVTKNKIRFVALIRGMPLKVREVGTYQGDQPDHATAFGATNASSVDSEIAVLGRLSRQISGPMTNPYFENFDRIDAVELPQIMLVARLDGPTYDNVKRMIDNSVRTERSGLSGWAVLDERGTELPGYKMGDDWMKKAGVYLGKAGFPVWSERTEPILPAGLPLPKTAVYLGWYSGDVAGALAGNGPRFSPGAIACHLHSFSASTVRSATSGWCGPLVSAGADAVLGNVYEPYLTLTASLDIFTERLLRGFTFAESAWASLRTTSWMNVAIGDPLYRPFANLEASRGPDFQTFKVSSARDLVNFDTGLCAEAWAQRKLAEDDLDRASFLFQKALKKYRDPDNLARVAWSYSQLLLRQNNKSDALFVLKSVEQETRNSPAGSFLLGQINQLDPPPPPPTPVPATGKFLPSTTKIGQP